MSRDTVRLQFPATTTHVGLARTVAAAMAAEADLPIDQVEDMRLAIDEAVSQLLVGADDDSDVTCAFQVSDGSVTVTVSAPTSSGQVPSTDTFGWTVLRALVDELEAFSDASTVTLRMQMRRPAAVEL